MAPWPIVGHEWALGLLEHAIESRRLHHAYLFTGPAQVGKTTLARAFAQALFCETGTSFPCGQCRNCQRISQGRHPDVQLVAAERNSIQIDQVRMLQSGAALSPLEGKYRVFIIPEIERATLPAANALLKTLEEPPPQVILLLTSTRRDQVLPTIVSRCQIVGLRPLPLEQIQTALEGRWGVDGESAALLARLSSGRLGWAVTAHIDPELWQVRTKAFDDLASLTVEGHYGRLAYVEALLRQVTITSGRAQETTAHTYSIETILGLWTTWWRDVWLIQHGLASAIINLDRRVQLAQQADLYRPEQVEGALTDLVETHRRLRTNVNARLALDVLALRLPTPVVM